jgi:hypothetical protein
MSGPAIPVLVELDGNHWAPSNEKAHPGANMARSGSYRRHPRTTAAALHLFELQLCVSGPRLTAEHAVRTAGYPNRLASLVSYRAPGNAETVCQYMHHFCGWREKREEAVGCVSSGLWPACIPTTNIVA